MDSMNFLNKKYTSIHNGPLVNSRSRPSRAFLPSSHFSQPSHHHSQRDLSINTTQMTVVTTPNSQIISNHCQIHQTQIIRHLCIDCIQLLCSQCINEHISVHRENNSFPNIHTLKQIKSQMSIKLQQIVGYLFKQQNLPKNMANAVDSIRKQSLQKIDNLKRDLHELVEAWILKLKNSIMNNVGYEEVKIIQQQMYGLHEEVNQLIISLSSNNSSPQDIKKAYQIDANRLTKSYKQMMDKYSNLSDSMKIEIDLQKSKFLQGLQQAVGLKIGVKKKIIIKVDDDDEKQSVLDKQEQQQINFPLQVQNNQTLGHYQIDLVPVLYHLLSGTQLLKVINMSEGKFQAKTFKIEGCVCYPLNSIALINDGMIVVSGGMMSENKKNDKIQVFDYQQGRIITEGKLFTGRSSHRTVIVQDKIFLIGGFTSQNQQCRDIQILTVDGVKLSENKCRWGGPNLSIRLNNQILKVTVSGVQAMNLQTLKWKQMTTEVPFALSKGMQICKYVSYGKQIAVIFGDDEFYYEWNSSKTQFEKIESNLNKAVISSTCVKNSIYAWVDEGKTTVVKLQGKKWIEMN